jgi:hypothetical protein
VPRRTTDPVETVTYNGVEFRRYPASERRTDRVYFTPGGSHRDHGLGRLHQEIWKDLHGPIPPGCDVHHADGDPLNNDPGNLVLAAGSEHRGHHRARRGPVDLTPAREAARAWHGSPAGIAWHGQHGRESWANRSLVPAVCEYCSAEYRTRKPFGARYCSNKCKSAARRASGVDDETRTCAHCGRDWTVNRYLDSECCSRQCAQALRQIRAQDGL